MPRTLAQSFGNVAVLYDRVRPEYSKAALDRLCSELKLGRQSHVLDLAAGTGKLTRALARRFERVVAVEPDDAMRSMLFLPGVEVLAGTAERIPTAFRFASTSPGPGCPVDAGGAAAPP